MATIQKIIIATYHGDYWLCKICVASIRRWYPDVPISLIKDQLRGDFDTTELEESHDVSILDVPLLKFGWGVSKFEPYFLSTRERVLIIDADIIFVGRLLERLSQFDEDFVISPEFPEDTETKWFHETYYDLPKLLLDFDPQFEYPNYVFNTGQLVCYTGMFQREDFFPFVDYSDTPRIKHGDVFKCADQGILNYLLPKKAALGGITVAKDEFMTWSLSDKAASLDFELSTTGEGSPTLIHWAGDNARYINRLQRSDLLRFYQAEYYRRVRNGRLKRLAFNFCQGCQFHQKQLLNQVRGCLRRIRHSIRSAGSSASRPPVNS